MSSYKNNGVSYFVIISKLHLWDDNYFLTKENNTKLVHKFSLKDQINATNNKIFIKIYIIQCPTNTVANY